MWAIEGAERLRCPDEFQQRITEAGGVNRYDEPNFRIVWGDTETFRAGGSWEPLDGPHYRGYRDLLLVNEACWALLQWQPPEKWGHPAAYYFRNVDESGFQTLGEYPYHGRYELIQPFVNRTYERGKITVDAMPLSSLLIDMVIPIIKESQAVSALKVKELMRERRERQEKEQVDQIEACIRNASPEYVTRSAARLGCNSTIQKRMEIIEKQWKQAVRTIRSRGKGMSVGQI